MTDETREVFTINRNTVGEYAAGSDVFLIVEPGEKRRGIVEVSVEAPDEDSAAELLDLVGDRLGELVAGHAGVNGDMGDG